MSKAPINKTLTVSATGILVMNDGLIGIENMENGEVIPFTVLFEDFADKIVSISIDCNEEFGCTYNEE
jgi:aromatic ring-opening dioxygenase catalytic subunit (LigB family)